MRISVITRWFNEEFFAPYFCSHYAFADEIIIQLERSTEDRSAEIARRFPNVVIEWTDTGGVVNDRIFSDAMSDLAASLDSDWVIRADADELIWPGGASDVGTALASADGNVIEVIFKWIYRHKDDPDLDPSKPALRQRRHGGPYAIWPGMGATFTKPSVVRPESGIRWRPGEQGYHIPAPDVRMSSERWHGAHWQMVDVEEAVRRLLSAEARLSDENRKNNWGVRRFTEEMIRAECARHLDDPAVL